VAHAARRPPTLPRAQVLDATVVIPQQGCIRSLNVHVSGALGIYEYARQHAGSSCCGSQP
jgi:tRNA(Leu) C34 or U34 (ribose-2'-O)-methylase TrmL